MTLQERITALTQSIGADIKTLTTLLEQKPDGVIGEIKAYAGAVVPAGYLWCDGGAVSRITHAALFAVIGTAFGAGDGVSTFNLPDTRRSVLLGTGAASGTSFAVGASGYGVLSGTIQTRVGTLGGGTESVRLAVVQFIIFAGQ